jgi:hypothetical protein
MTSPWPSPDPSTRETTTPPPAPVLTAPRAIAVVAGAVLLVAGLVGLLALAGDDEERPESAVATTELPEPTDEPTLTGQPPRTEPAEPGAGTGAPATSAAAATTAATGATSPAAATVPTTATSAAAPTASSPGAAPAPPPPPATAPAPAPAPAPPAPQAQQAVALAQQLGDALAAGQWDAARALNPGRNESDAFLQQAYGPLVRTTVVPATVVDTGRGRFDLRIGLVAHEEQPSGPQSVLMCAHWKVDVPASTIDRLSFNRLRVEPGFVDPASRADELKTTCATGG